MQIYDIVSLVLCMILLIPAVRFSCLYVCGTKNISLQNTVAIFIIDIVLCLFVYIGYQNIDILLGILVIHLFAISIIALDQKKIIQSFLSNMIWTLRGKVIIVSFYFYLTLPIYQTIATIPYSLEESKWEEKSE